MDISLELGVSQLVADTLSMDGRCQLADRMRPPLWWQPIWAARALEAFDPSESAFWCVVSGA